MSELFKCTDNPSWKNQSVFPHSQSVPPHAPHEISISRRTLLNLVAMAGASSTIWRNPSLALAAGTEDLTAPRFSFDGISANTLDTVTVPAGYRWRLLIRWADPLWSDGSSLDPTTGGTAASQARAFGDNTDGMELFVSSSRVVLAVNSEYINHSSMFVNRESGRAETSDDVRKSQAAHGVNIFEINYKDGEWAVVLDSPVNRKITANTTMEITGPARGHAWMKTDADPTGTRSLGTWNNCGTGRTPWGTYLTGEENFHNYFSSSDSDFKPSAAMKRYGIGNRDRGYRWILNDSRFDISRHPNEINRSGYVVEIDPLDPTSVPKKRTALGRFKHENAEVAIATNGQIVVYLGDDERGEFLYKFVSDESITSPGDHRNFLEAGTLYVARFSDNHRGEWLPLTPETTGFASQAEICIHTRLAASKLAPTTMDRPEWVAINPTVVEGYCSLTNNKNRGLKPNAGGDPTPVGGPNPREGNPYGQVVRWIPDGENHAATGFSWDLFVLAGNPVVHQDSRRGSENINAANLFNSPDGLAFDSRGFLWIQTDGNYTDKGDFAGMGNNQMLCADTNTGEIRRFLVGPKGCEITGLTWSPDLKTMFAGVQHPGGKGGSSFPDGEGSLPRSSIIAIQREDGGKVG